VIVVYASIWIALVFFIAGETGRTLTPTGRRPPAWAAWTFLTGCVIAIVHTILAFAIAHNWSHADAVFDTARLTKEMYGVDFGQALYMNYVFLGVWLADAVWWIASPNGHVRPAFVTWTLRGFYALYLFNAMVVFSHHWRRTSAWASPTGLGLQRRRPSRVRARGSRGGRRTRSGTAVRTLLPSTRCTSHTGPARRSDAARCRVCSSTRALRHRTTAAMAGTAWAWPSDTSARISRGPWPPSLTENRRNEAVWRYQFNNRAVLRACYNAALTDRCRPGLQTRRI
jgi:hypothetical protein